MHLAATYINLGPSTLVTIAVALIATVASIVAAVVAARSAGSTKRLEVQAQRIRDLESRISERKYKERYSKPHVIEKKKRPRAASNAFS
jgi:cell division protein FtsL